MKTRTVQKKSFEETVIKAVKTVRNAVTTTVKVGHAQARLAAPSRRTLDVRAIVKRNEERDKANKLPCAVYFPPSD